MIALWILAGIGLYYVTMGFVFLFVKKKPFVRFGNSLLTGTSIDINPQEYACEKLYLNPVEPYKIKDVGGELQVTFYFKKEEYVPENGSTV